MLPNSSFEKRVDASEFLLVDASEFFFRILAHRRTAAPTIHSERASPATHAKTVPASYSTWLSSVVPPGEESKTSSPYQPTQDAADATLTMELESLPDTARSRSESPSRSVAIIAVGDDTPALI